MGRTESATRERLARLLAAAPPGSKGSLARVCGFASRRRLRAVAHYNAYLTAPVARRINSIMDAIEAGRLVPVDSGRIHAGSRVLYWQWR